MHDKRTRVQQYCCSSVCGGSRAHPEKDGHWTDRPCSPSRCAHKNVTAFDGCTHCPHVFCCRGPLCPRYGASDGRNRRCRIQFRPALGVSTELARNRSNSSSIRVGGTVGGRLWILLSNLSEIRVASTADPPGSLSLSPHNPLSVALRRRLRPRAPRLPREDSRNSAHASMQP